MHVANQLGQVGDAQGIMANIGGDDVRAEIDEIVVSHGIAAGDIVHFGSFSAVTRAKEVASSPETGSVEPLHCKSNSNAHICV